ncbi:MAG: hypothetical protein QM723_38870 [Myxococcaceae bacterium]
MGPPKVDSVQPNVNRPTISNAPPSSIDVSKIEVDSPEFKNLPPAYQKAVSDAKTYAARFKDMSPPPKIMVTASSDKTNGGQPVTVVVPPGAKPPMTVQTHYHGDRAHSLSGTNGAAEQIADNIRKGDTTVYVLPEAQKPADSGTDWTNCKDIGGTTREALKNAGVPADGATFDISVHSGGGRALANAINNGEKIQARELTLQDATYENAWSTLKAKLGDQKGIKHVTIQGSKEADGTLGARHTSLQKILSQAGIPTDIAPKTETHDQASRTFTPPAAHQVDRFEHR